MTKRLQVILQEPEYREIQRVARSRHMSIAEWVRQALAHARRSEPLGDVDKKLRAIRAAAAQNAGSAVDIGTMLSEIEQGYRSGRP
ncbi:MAG TPA: antitoxin [Candidatus Dormibacteraeota bacterium]|nr:antitoxin [Candidatus Dormibacteraeota bacterium]